MEATVSKVTIKQKAMTVADCRADLVQGQVGLPTTDLRFFALLRPVVYARGRLPLLHGHEDGDPAHWQLRLEEGRADRTQARLQEQI